jgi:hypothetical protein
LEGSAAHHVEAGRAGQLYARFSFLQHHTREEKLEKGRMQIREAIPRSGAASEGSRETASVGGRSPNGLPPRYSV